MMLRWAKGMMWCDGAMQMIHGSAHDEKTCQFDWHALLFHSIHILPSFNHHQHVIQKYLQGCFFPFLIKEVNSFLFWIWQQHHTTSPCFSWHNLTSSYAPGSLITTQHNSTHHLCWRCKWWCHHYDWGSGRERGVAWCQWAEEARIRGVGRRVAMLWTDVSITKVGWWRTCDWSQGRVYPNIKVKVGFVE